MIFHKGLLSLQKRHPHQFGEGFDVVNKYSAQQSLRRGLTAQVRNVKVPKDVIVLNNQWRSEESLGHRFAGRGEMLELYTDVLAALDTLLQYSTPL
ncbi:hypothetical protein ACA910_002146 [Epithemia clementina (nom. ined.)]